MKTLLTGANGLVGSTITADIRLGGRSDLDLRDWVKTHKFFFTNQPKQVIHCAGKVGGVWANMNHLG